MANNSRLFERQLLLCCCGTQPIDDDEDTSPYMMINNDVNQQEYPQKNMKSGTRYIISKTKVHPSRREHPRRRVCGRGRTKDRLRVVAIGHAGSGKSTLVGHLLYSVGRVSQHLVQRYEKESSQLGQQASKFAWIVDRSGEERSRGMTIELSQSTFQTDSKEITVMDAPGRQEFIPNMISGLTRTDVALLVIDASRGTFEKNFQEDGQTRVYALLARSLGILQLGVVINKLDAVDCPQKRYEEIVGQVKPFLKAIGFTESEVSVVPCVSFKGENLAHRPEDGVLKWYRGPCLLEIIINKFRCPERPITNPLRFMVNDVHRGDSLDFQVQGRVETGILNVGDKLLLQPHNKTAVIRSLSFAQKTVQAAYAGDQVVATLSGSQMQCITPGCVLCDPTRRVPMTSRFEAKIVLFNIKVPIKKGFTATLHYQSAREHVVISKLIALLNMNSNKVVQHHPSCVQCNSSALVELEASRPICVEPYQDIRELGRFMLQVGGITIAAGLVTRIV